MNFAEEWKSIDVETATPECFPQSKAKYKVAVGNVSWQISKGLTLSVKTATVVEERHDSMCKSQSASKCDRRKEECEAVS